MLSQSLDGVLVLDLSQHLSGPFTSRILSDLGARIVKVEAPGGRVVPPWPGDAFPGFLGANVSKESIVVDMKSAAGRGVVHDLAAHADVVIENYRPGVTKRLGVDYDSLRAIRPDIIYCSITGFGSTGPLAQKPAFDATIQAMSGIMHATGEADRPPALTTMNIGDLAASCLAATAITSALHGRTRTGEGAHIDMSMLEAALYLLPIQTQFALQTGHVMGRHGSSYGPNSIAGALRSADGQYFQVLCPHFGFQTRFRDAIAGVEGFAETATDPRFADAKAMAANNDMFMDIAREAFAKHDAAYWISTLDAADVPWGPILDFKQVVGHEQVIARGAIGDLGPPGGGARIPTVRSAFHLAAGEASPPMNVPAFGEHSRTILTDLLGYPPERIEALLADQIIFASNS